MRARGTGRLVAGLWLLAVVLLYFGPGLLPRLEDLSNVSPPGMPAAVSVLAGIGHLLTAAAVFAAAWGIGRTLVLELLELP